MGGSLWKKFLGGFLERKIFVWKEVGDLTAQIMISGSEVSSFPKEDTLSVVVNVLML